MNNSSTIATLKHNYKTDAAAGPVLVEAVVDPYEPPMPPKVSLRQAEKFAESLVRGEPNRTKIVTTIAEDRVRELV